MLRPCFTRDQINDLDTQTKHIEALMQRLPTDEKGWTETVDLQNLFFSFTIDHATEFLFGESAQVQTGTGPLDGKAFVEAYEHCTDTSADRFRYGAMYWLHNPTSYREACDKVHQFVDYYVNLALESSDTTNARQTRSEKGCKEKYVFLDELVQQTRDPLKLRAELLNILLAGRDTTSALLGFLFALLARHPHHFARLSEAVLLAFGSEDQPKGEINFTTLKACSMLQYTLSEALRLYPVVPINGPRVARKDTTLPRGGGEDGLSPVFVPKGTQVDYMVYSTHRDSDFWGDDVEMFKPERWRARKSGFEFLPFNAGESSPKSSCPASEAYHP